MSVFRSVIWQYQDLAGPVLVPPPPEVEKKPSAFNGPLVPISRIVHQYSAISVPVFVPAPPIPVEEMAWRPIYPDIIWARPRAAEYPPFWWSTFIPEIQPVPDLAWNPVYPDFARRAARAAEYPAFHWSTFTPVQEGRPDFLPLLGVS